MGDIVFSCDGCGQKLAIDQTGAGMDITCPTCAAPLVVPKTAAAPSLTESQTAGSPEMAAGPCQSLLEAVLEFIVNPESPPTRHLGCIYLYSGGLFALQFFLALLFLWTPGETDFVQRVGRWLLIPPALAIPAVLAKYLIHRLNIERFARAWTLPALAGVTHQGLGRISAFAQVILILLLILGALLRTDVALRCILASALCAWATWISIATDVLE